MPALPRRKVLLWVSLGVFGPLLVATTLVLGVFWWYGRGVAAHDSDALRNYKPLQVTRILSRDGQVIGEIYRERRTVVRYERIPSHVENAFLAAEDADFHRHEGMDYFGMARAFMANLRAGSIQQGASTITQQVVKIFMLSPQRTLERKVQELLLARRLEQSLSKRQILELYLNEIYLGHGRYGVEEASRFYFGKGVADINLGQAALLAGLPKAPSRDSPIGNPDGAKKRQVYVLQQMVRLGWATARDAQRFIDASLDVSAAERTQVVAGADEFVDAARSQLEQRFGADSLDRLGATVHTTVDLEVQEAARNGLRKGLVALDHRQGFGHGNKPAKPRNLERARSQGGPLEVGREYPVVVTETPSGLPNRGFAGVVGEHKVFVRVPEGSRYDDPEKTLVEQFPVDSITRARIRALPGANAEGPKKTDPQTLPTEWAEAVLDSGPEAAVIVADVESGEVLAMVGGFDHRRGQFNRALQAKRQPGSAFKPFVYGAALQSRMFTPATVVSDSPEIYEKWKPTNFEADVYRGDIRLRVALTHSVNTVAIKILDAIGFQRVHEFARAAGIESPLAENLSLALGTSEVSPHELLTGYLTLARKGSRVAPAMIRTIELPGKKPVSIGEDAEPSLPENVVFLLTSLMQSVVEEGTGAGAKQLGRPVAGKTGTSGDHRDAWFAGFTPDRVAVAWVGFDTPQRIGRGETGGRAALPIWLTAMQAAVGDRPARPFLPPPDITVRTIDPSSGLLVPTGSPVAGSAPPIEEYFLPGTEPVEEAVPEAMPAGDVLLDLYGDGDGAPEAAPTEDQTLPGRDQTAVKATTEDPLPSLAAEDPAG